MKWVTSDTNYMNVNAELQSESQSTVGQYSYIHGCLFLLTKVWNIKYSIVLKS